jgi:hypothetical protein
MRNYTANDIEAMYKPFEKHITHVIVAHTNLRPYNARSEIQLENMLLQTRRACTYALNCFNKLLYPNATNKPIRQPHLYRPLTLVTTEGARWTLDRAQTIHVNIALGNLPQVLTTEDIETLFRHTWHNMAQQGTDIKVIEHYGTKWVGYSLKEAQQQPSRAWDTNSNWDVGNCWIPTAALNAD